MKAIINILSVFAILFVFQANVIAGNGESHFELTDFVVESSINIENNLSMLEGIKYLVVVTDANDEVVSSQAFNSEERVFSIDCTEFSVGMHNVKILTQGAKPVIIPVLKGGTIPTFETIVASPDDEDE